MSAALSLALAEPAVPADPPAPVELKIEKRRGQIAYLDLILDLFGKQLRDE